MTATFASSVLHVAATASVCLSGASWVRAHGRAVALTLLRLCTLAAVTWLVTVSPTLRAGDEVAAGHQYAWGADCPALTGGLLPPTGLGLGFAADARINTCMQCSKLLGPPDATKTGGDWCGMTCTAAVVALPTSADASSNASPGAVLAYFPVPVASGKVTLQVVESWVAAGQGLVQSAELLDRNGLVVQRWTGNDTTSCGASLTISTWELPVVASPRGTTQPEDRIVSARIVIRSGLGRDGGQAGAHDAVVVYPSIDAIRLVGKPYAATSSTTARTVVWVTIAAFFAFSGAVAVVQSEGQRGFTMVFRGDAKPVEDVTALYSIGGLAASVGTTALLSMFQLPFPNWLPHLWHRVLPVGASGMDGAVWVSGLPPVLLWRGFPYVTLAVACGVCLSAGAGIMVGARILYRRNTTFMASEKAMAAVVASLVDSTAGGGGAISLGGAAPVPGAPVQPLQVPSVLVACVAIVAVYRRVVVLGHDSSAWYVCAFAVMVGLWPVCVLASRTELWRYLQVAVRGHPATKHGESSQLQGVASQSVQRLLTASRLREASGDVVDRSGRPSRALAASAALCIAHAWRTHTWRHSVRNIRSIRAASGVMRVEWVSTDHSKSTPSCGGDADGVPNPPYADGGTAGLAWLLSATHNAWTHPQTVRSSTLNHVDPAPGPTKAREVQTWSDDEDESKHDAEPAVLAPGAGVPYAKCLCAPSDGKCVADVLLLLGRSVLGQRSDVAPHAHAAPALATAKELPAHGRRVLVPRSPRCGGGGDETRRDRSVHLVAGVTVPITTDPRQVMPPVIPSTWEDTPYAVACGFERDPSSCGSGGWARRRRPRRSSQRLRDYASRAKPGVGLSTDFRRLRHAMVPVQRATQEWDAVTTHFRATAAPESHPYAILRIQNPALWASYRLRVAELVAREPAAGLCPFQELLLWHGTRPGAVPSIASHGFQPLLGQRAMYGRGCYFAIHAAMAQTFHGTHDMRDFNTADDTGHFPMPACKCRAGGGSTDECRERFLRGPPPGDVSLGRVSDGWNGWSDRDDSEECGWESGELLLARVAVGAASEAGDAVVPGSRHGQVWDTALDSAVLPRAVVVFHAAQSYPAYLVRYKSYRCVCPGWRTAAPAGEDRAACDCAAFPRRPSGARSDASVIAGDRGASASEIPANASLACGMPCVYK